MSLRRVLYVSVLSILVVSCHESGQSGGNQKTPKQAIENEFKELNTKLKSQVPARPWSEAELVSYEADLLRLEQLRYELAKLNGTNLGSLAGEITAFINESRNRVNKIRIEKREQAMAVQENIEISSQEPEEKKNQPTHTESLLEPLDEKTFSVPGTPEERQKASIAYNNFFGVASQAMPIIFTAGSPNMKWPESTLIAYDKVTDHLVSKSKEFGELKMAQENKTALDLHYMKTNESTMASLIDLNEEVQVVLAEVQKRKVEEISNGIDPAEKKLSSHWLAIESIGFSIDNAEAENFLGREGEPTREWSDEKLEKYLDYVDVTISTQLKRLSYFQSKKGLVDPRVLQGTTNEINEHIKFLDNLKTQVENILNGVSQNVISGNESGNSSQNSKRRPTILPSNSPAIKLEKEMNIILKPIIPNFNRAHQIIIEKGGDVSQWDDESLVFYQQHIPEIVRAYVDAINKFEEDREILSAEIESQFLETIDRFSSNVDFFEMMLPKVNEQLKKRNEQNQQNQKTGE